MSNATVITHATLQPGLLFRRRFLFFSCVLLLTSLASWVMADLLWRNGFTRLEFLVFSLFIPLFSLVSFGFVQALFGSISLARGGDTRRVTATTPPAEGPLPATAVVVPIFNEDVGEVYEGIRMTLRSLESTGQAGRFDFFILSDSRDPNKWIEEEVAWVELCKQVRGFGRIFYRHRRVPLNRKSGNISDFCRRWGGKYHYMVVFDADSLMTGSALVQLVRMMEAHPRAGIIQSAPALARGETLYGRLMQFASTLYGPAFLAGLHYWQGYEGNYWGHNAIIRVAPFMESCALPDIPGGAGSHAKFMSHDYVEAALMLRSGYEVWLAHDLPGSYEGAPPTLIDCAQRDRRWCKGNLQHAWLLFAKGFRPATRMHLLLGIMSYLASPLWLLFLVAGTLQVYLENHVLPRRFDVDVGLSRLLDIGGARLSLLLFIFTMALLLAPKLLGWAQAMLSPERRRAFGGGFRLTASCLTEQIASMLMAPILMLFHTRFVLEIMFGVEIGWGTQVRGVDGADWARAIRAHAWQLLTGLLWGAIAWRIHPAFFWWMSPVLGSLLFAIPFSALLSLPFITSALPRWGLFATPQETAVPPEIVQLEWNISALHRRAPPPHPLREDYGFMQAVLDPLVNAVHVSLSRQQHKHRADPGGHYLLLEEKVLRDGPGVLTPREKRALLLHPGSMARLHRAIWMLPDSRLSPWWTLAMRQYNTLTHHPHTALYR